MTVRPPKYQLHKATGQARVRIKGRDIYLGKYRSPESEQRYRQVIADWLKNQDRVTRQDSARPTRTTNRVITELILDYLTFAKTIYVKDGKETGDDVRIDGGVPSAERFIRRHPSPTIIQSSRQTLFPNSKCFV